MKTYCLRCGVKIKAGVFCKGCGVEDGEDDTVCKLCIVCDELCEVGKLYCGACQRKKTRHIPKFQDTL